MVRLRSNNPCKRHMVSN